MDRAKEGLHILMEVSARRRGLSIARLATAYSRAETTPRWSPLAPESGRQHQLRVHLAALGFPIIGDKLYGPEGVQTFLDYIETGMTDELRQRLGHDRQALHAFELEFTHPSTGEPRPCALRSRSDLVALWGEPLDESTFASARAC